MSTKQSHAVLPAALALSVSTNAVLLDWNTLRPTGGRGPEIHWGLFGESGCPKYWPPVATQGGHLIVQSHREKYCIFIQSISTCMASSTDTQSAGMKVRVRCTAVMATCSGTGARHSRGEGRAHRRTRSRHMSDLAIVFPYAGLRRRPVALVLSLTPEARKWRCQLCSTA